MSTALISFTSDQLDLIKRTIAKGASDDELKLFMAHCNRTGLDPFAKQIYCIARKAKDDQGNWVNKMETQVSIDGLRLIAERTERYVPGREPSYKYDDKGNLVSATAYVKKLAGGVWHDVSATAFYFEYVQLKRDGNPNQFWATKPHIMLAKCAEALALRRAFPHEMGGLYTDDEIPEAEVVEAKAAKRIENKPESEKPPQKAVAISEEELAHLHRLVDSTGTDPEALADYLGVASLANLTSLDLDAARNMCELQELLNTREYDADKLYPAVGAAEKSIWHIPHAKVAAVIRGLRTKPMRAEETVEA